MISRHCFNCDKEFLVAKRSDPKKFCCKSCSAKCNNYGRSHSTETKNRISSKLKGQHRPNTQKRELRTCLICHTQFYIQPCKKNVTCSRSCGNKVAFQNRKSKSHKCLYIKYLNKFDNNIVVLQSNWELQIANYLDKNNICWLRPKPLPWTCKKNIKHLYYPDFYVPELDLYLDPKNDQVIKQDQEKLRQIQKDVNLVYGSVLTITSAIEMHRFP
jgi:hypothetical protein